MRVRCFPEMGEARLEAGLDLRGPTVMRRPRRGVEVGEMARRSDRMVPAESERGGAAGLCVSDLAAPAEAPATTRARARALLFGLITVLAIHWTVTAGFERHCSLLTTTGTGHGSAS